jgi:hypothetical protein
MRVFYLFFPFWFRFVFGMFTLSCIEIEYSWYDEGTDSDKEIICRVIFIIEF